MLDYYKKWKEGRLSQTSMEVFKSPRLVEKFSPLKKITLAGLELELYEEQIPLVCCLAIGFLGKKKGLSLWIGN